MSLILFLISHILFQEVLQNPYLELRLFRHRQTKGAETEYIFNLL